MAERAVLVTNSFAQSRRYSRRRPQYLNYAGYDTFAWLAIMKKMLIFSAFFTVAFAVYRCRRDGNFKTSQTYSFFDWLDLVAKMTGLDEQARPDLISNITRRSLEF